MTRIRKCHGGSEYELHKEQRKELRRQLKIQAIEYKGNICGRCKGIFEPCVYDFHHVDPCIKEASSSTFLNWSWKNMKTELDKCTLLCANCHRLEHNTIGYNSPRKGKQMNEIIDSTTEVVDGVKRYVLTLDKNGDEVKVEIQPNGEFSQDVEDKEEVSTVH